MIRLNRYIAESGYCSRRKADELIKDGRVRVNSGVVRELGLKVDPEKDIVEVEGKQIKPFKRVVYIRLYKPRGYLTALGKDKFGKKTLTDLFREINLREKVFPAGRLDFDSEGLLILTNDGNFAHRLTHPRFKVDKVYHLKVDRVIDQETLEKMREGIELEDGFFKLDSIRIMKVEKDFTWVEAVIHSGKKRILRRFFKAFNHTVLRLVRVKIGDISVKGLRPGEYSYIPQSQIDRLLKKEGEDEKRDSFK
ncbi:MAG: rRNA pseudouridine synthase [Hydrogenothermaceae bacterium]|nr:rRNA pseudouridine synthase [Hydrogenothermaceae bacterium]